MPSELQRVAQALLAALDEMPRVVGYLQDTARRCRESAALVGSMSNNPAARMTAVQLDEAARRCEEAAHYLAQAPPRARGWVEQMVSGVRTAEPSGDGTPLRPGAAAGRSPSEERRRRGESLEPADKDSAGSSNADDKPGPDARPAVSDKEGWRLYGKLPERAWKPGHREKTSGIWQDADGTEHRLISGQRDKYYEQVKDFLREHRIGRRDGEPMVASHVEAKFALFMRERGLMHETIAVNKVPCTGDLSCDELLKRFLPPGGTLTVFGPGGFKETYPKPE